MPELAEVEFFRRRWEVGVGDRVLAVEAHPKVRVFRHGTKRPAVETLRGAVFKRSFRHGKQLLLQFSGEKWLGVHLGMSGELRVEPKPGDYRPGKHDHLALFQAKRVLVFSDPRQFGRIRFDKGAKVPEWFGTLPPEIGSPEFTADLVHRFLQRRARTPIKSILLMQECFPGLGNWMCDEVLFQARIAPRTLGGRFSQEAATLLWKKIGTVAAGALKYVAGMRESLPEAYGAYGALPVNWLFNHRWSDGGTCPVSGQPLRREVIGGRMTCWSPALQRPL